MCLENFYFHGPRGRSFIHALTFKKRSYKFSLFCDSHMGIVWTSQIFLMFRRLWNHLFSSSQNTFPVSESRLRDNKVHDYMDTVVVSVLWYPPLSVPKRMSVPRTISDPGRPDVWAPWGSHPGTPLLQRSLSCRSPTSMCHILMRDDRRLQPLLDHYRISPDEFKRYSSDYLYCHENSPVLVPRLIQIYWGL